VTDTVIVFYGLEENQEYQIRLMAVNETNHSIYSDVLVIHTRPVVPEAPSGLTVIPDEANNILVSWTDNSDNEDGFIIERKAGENNFAVLDSAGINTEEYLDQQTYYNINYAYRVKSFRRGSGTSSPIIVMSDPSNEEVIFILGLDESNKDSEIMIYPNPSGGMICFDVNEPVEKITSRLISIQGKIIHRVELKNGRNWIDLTPFPAGVYILQTEHSGKMLNIKVIRK
jgi:hypothetical protein